MNRVVIAILLMVSTLATVDAAGGLIHIWDGTGVGSHKVTLEAFPVAGGGDKVAVIVCPGGSYSWLDYDTEGTAVARWLNANGITAFVLTTGYTGTAKSGRNDTPEMSMPNGARKSVRHISAAIMARCPPAENPMMPIRSVLMA